MKWHAPDHTKIEEFRSRSSNEIQKALVNKITSHAVKLGFANDSMLNGHVIFLFQKL